MKNSGGVATSCRGKNSATGKGPGRPWAALDALPRRLLSMGFALIPTGLLDDPIHCATAQKYLAWDHPAFSHQWCYFDPHYPGNTTWLEVFLDSRRSGMHDKQRCPEGGESVWNGSVTLLVDES